jgi:hypothetical protein
MFFLLKSKYLWDMKSVIKRLLREAFEHKDEILTSYGGRYEFDIKKALTLINNNQIKGLEKKKFNPVFLNQFSHPIFTTVDTEKVERLKTQLDLSKPLGLLVNFMNPENKKTEWMLIDGNHRVRAAAEMGEDGILYVISDPKEVKKFIKFDKSIPYKMFPDDEEV